MSALRAGSCKTTATSHVRSRLPVLERAGVSRAWDVYLARVYGPLPAAAYPIDLRTFGWFYYRGLPLDVQAAQLRPHCEAAFGHAWTGPHDASWPESLPSLS